MPHPRHRSRLSVALLWIAAFAILFGGWYAYDVHIRHRLHAVTDGQVYKSAAMPPEEMATVAKRLGLRAVIDFRTYVPGQDSTNTTPLEDIRGEARALAAIGVRHIHLPTPQVPDAAVVDKFLSVMADPANRPVLIHCYHGIGRAELFTALYRIEFEGWSNDRARHATRFFLPGSSFSDRTAKGRFLMTYQPQRNFQTSKSPGAWANK